MPRRLARSAGAGARGAFMRIGLRSWILALFAACLSIASPMGAEASFLDDAAALDKAITSLRATLGPRPRVLKIEVNAKAVAIEAQDTRNPAHIDRWRC